MASNLGTAYIEILPSTDKLIPGIKGALGNESSGPLAREGKRGGNLLAGALGAGLKVAGGAVIGAAAAGVGMAFTKGLDRYMKIEGAEKKLSALGHSAEGVATIMDGALKSVKGTAFGLGDAADVAASAVASGIKPGQQLDQTLKTIANTAAIAGSDMGSMGAIFNKVAANGKIQGDELAQLADRGVPALAWLSKELGVTSGEVADLASKGKIDFETFERAMRNGMSPDAAVQMGDTLSGTWDNLGASLGRLGAEVMERVGPAIKDGMKAATDAVDQAAGAIGPALDGVGQFAQEVIDNFTQMGDGGALSGVQTAFAGVQSSAEDLWRTAEPIFRDIWDWLVTKWAEIQPAVERIFTSVSGTIEEAMGIASTLVGNTTQEITRIWNDWGPTILGIVGGIMDSVAGIFEGAFEVVRGIFQVASGLLSGDTEKMKEGILTIFNGLKTGAEGIFRGMVGALGSIWGGIKQNFSGPVNWVINNVLNPLAQAVNKMAETFGAKWRVPLISTVSAGSAYDGSGGGGRNAMQAYATGGPVRGWSPSATADNIPIWATAGEFMVRQKSVRSLQRNHRGLLDYMNATGHLPPGYEPQGYAGGGRIIPNATQGFRNYDPGFLKAIQAWAAMSGRTWSMTGLGGARSYAQQAELYRRHLAGTGPLAANPARGGPHMYPGRAMDLSPRPGENAAARALLGRFGLGLTVPGEPWHVGVGNSAILTGGATGGWDILGGALDHLLKMVVPGGGAMGQILTAIGQKLVQAAIEGVPKLLFDSGGWLEPGATLAVNNTGQRERVLTAAQWGDFSRMVESMERDDFFPSELVVVDANGQLIGRMRTEAQGVVTAMVGGGRR